jgi:hypothetical protein
LIVRIGRRITLLSIRVGRGILLLSVWVLRRVALLSVRISLRGLAVMRIRVCGGRSGGGRDGGRSCGSSLLLVVGVVLIP